MMTITHSLPSDITKGFLAHPDDLSQLQVMDAQTIRALAENVNKLNPETLVGKKLVIVLATGGTLAMKTQGGLRVPHFDFESLFSMTDVRLHQHFTIQGVQAFKIDSSQMDYRHVRDIAIALTYLWKNIRVPFIGFLITHGTDTMSYTSAATSLIMGQGLPFSVVYTGSQQPAEDAMTDAMINIHNALYTLESLHAHDMAEVLIVMGTRGMLATSAEKVDDMLPNAFEAPRHRYITDFTQLDYPVRLAEWLKPRRTMDFSPTIWPGNYSHTLVVKSTLGLDPKMVVRQLKLPEVQAVILYSYGASTIYEGLIEAVMPAAQEKNIPVFVVNPVHADYRVEYVSSQKALEMRAVPLNMTLSAALAKIEIALRMYPNDVAALSAFMTENYVGEIPTALSRFLPAK